MIRHSIRIRLTAWYAAVTLLALAIMATTVWGLFLRSVSQAAQDRLTAQFEGIARFTASMEVDLALGDVRDEYREYTDMSGGNALVELTNGNGDVLVMPGGTGWTAATAVLTRAAPVANVTIGGEPYRASVAEFTDRGRPFRAVVAVPLGPSLDALKSARRLLLWLLPIMTLVAAGCGYLVSGRALKPVDVMTQTAREIHVGNLASRLSEPVADDELRRLAVTFNGMLGRLEAGVSDIARFTSEASHELRTPVAIVRTTAELALRQERTPADYRRALGEIHQQALEMTSLVDDLLAMARADAGVEQGIDANIDLVDVIRTGLEAWQRTAPEDAPVVTFVDHPTPIVVRGDPKQMQRVLRIVCDNAAKYTPAGALGGLVHVAVGVSGAFAHLVVDDNGIGIAPSDRPRIFERFFRAGRAREYAARGSGLGLPIAKAIVERLGGSIDVASPIGERLDRPGTRVVVRLPLTSGIAPTSRRPLHATACC